MSGLNRVDFRLALTELHACHDALAASTAGQSERWRFELIAARRKLQAQISRLSDVLSAAGNDDELNPVRQALNRMRSEVALHQASWPAVRIDLADPEYRASLNDLLKANREFTVIAEQLLAQ